jgi:HK97 family phage major capsid protein
VGGYMVLPTALLNQLISAIDELSEAKSLVTRFDNIDAKTLGITKVTSRGDDADWTAEVTSVTQDTSLALGRRDLTPYMLTKEVLVSMSLLQRSPQAQAFVIDQLARLFAVTEEKAILTGDGSNKPLGIFTASSNGVPTSRDVTAVDDTTISYADIVSLKYSMKAIHLKKAKVFCHRDFAKKCLLIVDDDNRPIFVPNEKPGLADTILGMPTSYSEFAPNTFTASQYVACLADMSRYYWVTGMQYAIQIADQIAARTNQVAMIGREEADGAPMLDEAFSRLKLAAS